MSSLFRPSYSGQRRTDFEENQSFKTQTSSVIEKS